MDPFALRSIGAALGLAAALVLVSGSAGAGGAAAQEAPMDFVLRDYLHHTWRGELVRYEVDAAKVPVPACLAGLDGQIAPVQVKGLPDGKVEVAFVVEELPADGEVRYTLSAGTGPSGSLVREEGQTLVLDAGAVAVRLPAVGEEHFAAPVPLAQVVAPLLAVRGAAGGGPMAGAGAADRAGAGAVAADPGAGGWPGVCGGAD